MKAPRFEIFKSDKDGQYYFRLRAKNGRIILASEGYTQKHNAEGGIDGIKSSVYNPFYQIRYYSVRVKDKDYWGFSIHAPNSEIIGRGETYNSKNGCYKGIASVTRCAPIAEIVDLSKD